MKAVIRQDHRNCSVGGCGSTSHFSWYAVNPDGQDTYVPGSEFLHSSAEEAEAAARRAGYTDIEFAP